jgi:hypothetical protein
MAISADGMLIRQSDIRQNEIGDWRRFSDFAQLGISAAGEQDFDWGVESVISKTVISSMVRDAEP